MFTELLRPRRGTSEALARKVARSRLLERLAAPHGVDRYIELVVPGFSSRVVRAEIVGVHRMTPRSVTLQLRPNELWQGFRAGQFTTLSIEIDGVRRTRCYSPAASQYGDGIELTVTAHDDGLVSRHLRERARPGMIVELTQAEGDFVLPSERPDELVLISGGSGITPVMSILRTLCDERHEGRVTFIHYARRPGEALYASELAQIAREHPNVTVRSLHTRGEGAAERFGAASLTNADAPVYVCGPPSLIDAVREVCTNVHSENFVPPATVDLGEGVDGTVRFLASETEVASDGATLLEQAERAGLTPAHACRMGVCHTCTCRKSAGRVRNVYTGELSSGEPEDIQICVSVPAGDVELEI
jgi:ferredoxin-NADP reductase